MLRSKHFCAAVTIEIDREMSVHQARWFIACHSSESVHLGKNMARHTHPSWEVMTRLEVVIFVQLTVVAAIVRLQSIGGQKKGAFLADRLTIVQNILSV